MYCGWATDTGGRSTEGDHPGVLINIPNCRPDICNRSAICVVAARGKLSFLHKQFAASGLATKSIGCSVEFSFTRECNRHLCVDQERCKILRPQVAGCTQRKQLESIRRHRRG